MNALRVTMSVTPMCAGDMTNHGVSPAKENRANDQCS